MKKIIAAQVLIYVLPIMLSNQMTFAMEQTFYKWEDKDGSTHYTLTPPPKGMKSLGKMQTYRDFSPSPHLLMPPQNAEKLNVPEEQLANKEQQDNMQQNHQLQPSSSSAQTSTIPMPVVQQQIMRPVFQQGVPASQLPMTIKQNGREYIPLPR